MIEQQTAVGVIGCGRMGRLHARVFSQMPQVKLAGVYDVDPAMAQAVARDYACPAADSVEDLLENIQAVCIATPTPTHPAIALACIARGIACLIEKPLARTVEEARQIADAARQHNVLVQVGHIERFNPIVRAMARLEVQPRFLEVVRISPLTFRSIDVGVVLDMMIHDIDIVLSLARAEVERVEAIGVSVLGEVEDVCNARLTFTNGCVANMTASRLALKTERRLRVFSSDAYLSIDYQKRYGVVARKGENLNAIRDTVAKIRSGEITDLADIDYTELVQVEELQIDDIEPLRAELESFIDAFTQGKPPVVSAEDGLRAVQTAMRIVEAMPPQAL